MNSYEKEVKLPFYMMNNEAQIIEPQIFDERHGSLQNLSEKALLLKKPTIITVPHAVLQQEVFFFTTPFFTVNQQRMCIFAGPFVKKKFSDVEAIEQIMMLDEPVITQVYNHFHTLYEIVKMKQQIEVQNYSAKEWLEVFHKISKYDIEKNDQEHFMQFSLHELYKLNAISFVGYACLKEDSLFEVQYVMGEQEQCLLNNTFYLGEGLLGNALVYLEDFLWEAKDEEISVDFFQRQQLFPRQIFGIPLKDENGELCIMFGGNQNDEAIMHKEIKTLADVLRLVIEKQTLNTRLKKTLQYKVINAKFLRLLEMYNLNQHSLVIERLIELFEVFTVDNVIVTLPNESMYHKHQPSYTVLLQHYEQIRNIHMKPFSFVENNHYIHANLDQYGFYSIGLSQHMTMDEKDVLIRMIDSLLQLFTLKDEQQNVFDHLLLTLKDLNGQAYEQVISAIAFIENYKEQLKLTNSEVEIACNCCKVLPYSLDYLGSVIEGTVEFMILQQLFSQTHHVEDCLSLIVAFVNKHFIKRHTLLANLLYSNANAGELDELLINHDGCKIVADETILALSEESAVIFEQLMLTNREKEVFTFMLKGLNNHEIADALYISPHTVKNHLTNIFKKIGVTDRVQAVTLFYREKENVVIS